MKRKILFAASAAGAALIVFLIGHGTGDAGKRGAGLVRVSIDGNPFLPGGSFSDDVASLRRELSRMGVQPPEGIDLPETTGGSSPVFSEKLVAGEESVSAVSPRIPDGLAAEHVLRMEGENETLELVTGKLDGGTPSAAARLESDRWEPAMTSGKARIPQMLRKTRGKENSVVWLDEAESGFLLIRRLSR